MKQPMDKATKVGEWVGILTITLILILISIVAIAATWRWALAPILRPFIG